ncbi:MAG: hypothetical protein JSR39_02045 [Verrucomicrobia bacterium]|nr:hypothetical protein [Verrucomicrobiota bacterium]
MELGGRALYNLLRISWLEDPKIKVKPWQVEDYRSLSTDTLFARLKDLGIVLDEQSFTAYAESCDSPEDLVECLWVDEDDLDKQDASYLLLFEIWRRLLPQKQSLSVFCDELDQLIEQYDQGLLDDEEVLQKNLEDLEDILDEAADLSGSPVKVFEDLSQFCAHDLHGFLYDYISDLIERGDETYASELINAFYEFLPDKKWFDLLKAWLFASMDIEELNRVAGRLFEQLLDEPDLDLLLEIAKFLVHRGDVRLFMHAARHAIPLIKTEEQFQQLLRLVAEYYRCLDKDEEENHIHQLIQKRAEHDLQMPLDPSDKTLQHILGISKL